MTIDKEIFAQLKEGDLVEAILEEGSMGNRERFSGYLYELRDDGFLLTSVQPNVEYSSPVFRVPKLYIKELKVYHKDTA